MLLYLVRHAHAVSDEENPLRPLSARGREDVRAMASFFRQNQAFAPAQLWHSSLVRARETAEILWQELGLDGGLVETPGLLPEDDPEETATRVGSLMSVRPFAIVGHEPHLSALATLLIRGRTHPIAVEFKKGAVLALERTDEVHKKTGLPRWVAVWHVVPSLIRTKASAAANTGTTAVRPNP